MIQNILVGLAVVCALAYIARQSWNTWRGSSCGGGCGSGCSSKKRAEPALVKPEELLVRLQERRR